MIPLAIYRYELIYVVFGLGVQCCNEITWKWATLSTVLFACFVIRTNYFNSQQRHQVIVQNLGTVALYYTGDSYMHPFLIFPVFSCSNQLVFTMLDLESHSNLSCVVICIILSTPSYFWFFPWILLFWFLWISYSF